MKKLHSEKELPFIGDAIEAEQHGNYEVAVKMYEVLAQHGNAMAQLDLAVLYINLEGFPPNYIQAYKWLFVAKQSSSKYAQDDAKHYMDEYAKNMSSEDIEYAKALAKLNLAYICANNSLIDENYVHAFKWIRLVRHVGDKYIERMQQKLEGYLLEQMTAEQKRETDALGECYKKFDNN